MKLKIKFECKYVLKLIQMRCDSSIVCWLVRDAKSFSVFKTKGDCYELFQYNF